jgi:predicted amidohydrolase YtcJ
VANTLGLQKASLLSADAQDPYGGKFLRDRQGVPDGRLLHYPAIYAVCQPTMTPEEEYRAVLWGAQRFIEQGVTCVHDNFASQHANIAYVTAERRGDLPLRLRLYPYVANLQHCQQVVQRLKRYEGPLVRVQGVKLAVDGYPLMYNVLPQHRQINMPMHPEDQFRAIVATIHNAGLQADVHAAGDRGVDLTLEAFSRAAGGDRAVRERRHRMEHYMFYRQESIDRTAAMGVPVCTQPAWIDMRAADMLRRLGPEPVAKMVPLGSFREAGVAICFGADVCASPTHLPMDSIVPAVRRDPPGDVRLDPAERITFMQALQAHTLTAAYAAFDEQEMGSITPGKVADLAVWSGDLRQVNEDNVADQRVVATYVGGKRVWQA